MCAQKCLTLCNPMDCGLPSSSAHGIFRQEYWCMLSNFKLYTTLCNPMDCSTPGSSVHGIIQARILEWVDIPFSREYVDSSAQSLSRVRLFVTPWTAAHRASLSITNSWSLFKLMSIELVIRLNYWRYYFEAWS